MKTAILAAALIATASFVSADETATNTAETFSVIETSAAGNGQIEIITHQGSDYTLSRVNCLPLMSAILDTDNDLQGLSSGSGGVTMEEIARGTTRHEIATYACGNG